MLSRAPDGGAEPLESEPEQLTISQDYITCAEVAAVLWVSVRIVRRLVATGRIPNIRVGKQIRISRKSLQGEGA